MSSMASGRSETPSQGSTMSARGANAKLGVTGEGTRSSQGSTTSGSAALALDVTSTNQTPSRENLDNALILGQVAGQRQPAQPSPRLMP
jgi:hypothetical protein